MRIAVISDIHGNLPALEAVIADMRTRSPDSVVNLGDSVSAPLWPKETLECLDTISCTAIRGNHDRWLSTQPVRQLSRTNRFVYEVLTNDQRHALGELPAQVEVIPGVLGVHGTMASDTEYLLEDADDDQLQRSTATVVAERLAGFHGELVLCGHSHTQHCAAISTGCLIVNPGSVGCPRTVGHTTPLQAEAGSPHARYAVVTRKRSGWMVELLAVPYEWKFVVERATQNARPDWGEEFLGRHARGATT